MIYAAETTIELFRAVYARLRGLLAYPGFLGFCLTAGYVLAIAHIGLGLQDPGLHWYSAQRVLAGDIPLRDFDAYDPGRYYLAAAVMFILHSHGWLAFDVSLALCAGACLWLANSMVFRGQASTGLWLFLTVTLSFLLWLVPLFKAFDIVSSMVLVVSLAWLLQQPTPRRFFVNGLVVGAIAIIGRNHGLYGAIAGMLGICFIAWIEKRALFWPSFLRWSLGMVLGYAPMLLAIAFVPGFWTGLWATIHVYYEIGATNLTVPIPWPWTVDFTQPVTGIVRDLVVGCLFIVLPLYGLLGIGYYAWRARVRKLAVDPLLLATALVALPYTHHAYASAGLIHLTQAIHPMLIGVFALIVRMPRRRALALSTAVCALSVFMLLPYGFFYSWVVDKNPWQHVKIGPDTFIIDPFTAKRVAVLTHVVDAYAPGDREFVVEPFMPGAYALFDRRAAVWNTYPNVPADAEVQGREIRRIQAEHPGFILISGGPYPYQATHPLVYEFIVKNFVRTDDPAIPSPWDWELYLPPAAPVLRTHGPGGGTQVK